MIIRRATEADATEISSVHAESVRALGSRDYPGEIVEAWSRPRPLEDYRGSIAVNPFFVAEETGEVVGFAELETSRGKVRSVYVAPAHARKGVASSLLAALEEEARRSGLPELVLESSLTAVAFYESCGFVAMEPGRFRLRDGLEMSCVPMRKVLRIRVLVSSCLLGERVRYHGGDARADDPILRRWQEERRVVPFCPEVAGGLAVPRTPAEIQGGDGEDVRRRTARVLDRTGCDVTEAFLAGAEAAVETALRHGVRLAVLKDGSPSCGTSRIYDGTFEGSSRAGPGVAAAFLSRAGVRVFAEHQLSQAARFLDELEAHAARG